MKTWFITGASRGFGLLVAREAISRGDNVIATARKPEQIVEQLPDAGHQLLALALDVTDAESIEAAVASGIARYGRIDVLMNNAGHGLLGAVEEISDENARRVFEVNVFGLLNVTRAVLPVMRAQKSGRILNIGSLTGLIAAPGWGVYAASKHAVEAISEALRAEVAPLGIQSIAIEPAAFRTDFLDGSSLITEPTIIDDYATTPVATTRAWAVDANHGQLGDPDKAAKVIVDVAHADEVPIRLALGSNAVERIGAKLGGMTAELAAWKDISLATDF